MAWKKIICPIDFSPFAREAMQMAVSMAAESGAELVLAHVWQTPMLGGEMRFSMGLMQQMINDGEKTLALWQADAERLGARRVTSASLNGSPWNEIVEAIRNDPKIDLVVMGTHGRTGLKHVLLGSVAEKVVRHAPCPVLAVRARD